MAPHFHLHLLPRMPRDAPLGPHVMGREGWAGAVGAPVPGDQALWLIRALRDTGSGQGACQM